jgi:hypothetical protein
MRVKLLAAAIALGLAAGAAAAQEAKQPGVN